MKIIEVEPYALETRCWSEPEPATSFRTIEGLPIQWRDEHGIVHACEGADIHPDARVFWTLCGNEVAPDETYNAEDDATTCPLCQELALVANDP